MLDFGFVSAILTLSTDTDVKNLENWLYGSHFLMEIPNSLRIGL